MLDSNFWNDSETANKLVGELKNLKNIIIGINELSSSVKGNLEIINSDNDDEILSMVEEELFLIKTKINKLEPMNANYGIFKCEYTGNKKDKKQYYASHSLTIMKEYAKHV